MEENTHPSVLDADQIALLRDNADFCNARTRELLDRLIADYDKVRGALSSVEGERSEYTVFNVNDFVRVKLTPDGYAQWKAYDDAVWERMPDFYQVKHPKKPLLIYEAKADAEGYCEFQAWQLMQVMGPMLLLSSHLFQASILLKTADLTPLKADKSDTCTSCPTLGECSKKGGSDV